MFSGSKWYRPLCFGLAVVLLGVAGLELAYAILGPTHWLNAFGDDLSVLTDATSRLFSGGSWYQPWQMAPYPKGQTDVLYPPVVAWFFAPFLVLGPVVYVGLGVGIIVWLVWSWSPPPWTWPLMALCLLVPATMLKTISGNPSLWVAVAVGLGLRFGWPGALVLLKPTFLPFALAGIWTRGWWICAGALAVLSLPFLGPTLDYPRVLLDAKGETLLYSVWDWPLALIPVVAYTAGRGRVVTALDRPALLLGAGRDPRRPTAPGSPGGVPAGTGPRPARRPVVR